ncbi:MAG TPA: glycoside hydrolase family 3 N-terminal domain-containing protein [Longimicrobiales bacterium]
MSRNRSPLCLPALLLLAACARPAAVPPHAPAGEPEPSPEAWVDTTLARLTLPEKIGQLVFPWIRGDYLTIGSESYARLREWVVEDRVGGLVISIGPPLEIASKLNLLQQMADVPLLVTADMEHGPGQRLDGGTVLPYGFDNGGGTEFPPAMALGAAGDPALAYEMGRITALEARAVGIHMTFAPVVDVNNNPANPIINVRSFGEDPERVGELASAFIRGAQEHGLLATAKHFPGHGDTGVDSHLELPVLSVGRQRLDSIELPPFRAAIAAGVTGVMTAHIAFPALTGDMTPASLSPELVTGLLGDSLGFDGLVITDALDMGGVVNRYGPAEAAVAALKAGADVLLMPPDVGTTIAAVVKAVERGELTESRIDRSVRRLLRLKARLGLHRRRTVDPARIPEVVGVPEHLAVAERVAERSITVARDRDRLLPVRPLGPHRVLSIVYTDDVDPFAGRAFQAGLRERFAEVQGARLDRSAPPARLDSLRVAADSADVVFVSLFIRVVDRKGGLAVPEPVAALVRDIAARRPTIVTSFGNPYVVSQFPNIGTYVLAWGGAAVSQRAAARALTGQAPVTGALPISIPPDIRVGTGVHLDTHLAIVRPEDVGMDATVLAHLDDVLDSAIVSGAVPGAALAIGRHGRLVRLRGYGRLDVRGGFGAATDSTLYDLASLTKVIATTTAVMLLDEAGKLDLDTPVARILPEWHGPPGKMRVTIRHLLTHTSGLPAYGPLWRELSGRDAYLRRIAAMGLESPPGEKVVYSDYGMMLLGLIVERVSGQTLDAFLEQRVFGPLGMHDTGFNPLEWEHGGADDASPLLDRIAPTEVDTIFRMTHLHGVVHDENAYAIGGVAGHAGLFSSVRDLAVFAQMLLNGGSYGGTQILHAETIRRYTTRQPDAGSRALGWDTPSGLSSAGDYFSTRSFGHTGFTGTSIWVDPERDIFVVLLTNRVNPTRQNHRHVPLRRTVHDLAQQAITDMPVVARVDVAS